MAKGYTPAGNTEQATRAGDLRAALLYAAGSFGAGLFFGFGNAPLPLFLARHTSSAFLIGLVGSLRPIAAVVVYPLVGAWSDRLRTPWGRRRVFVWLGVPPCAALLAVTPLAGSLWSVALLVGLFGLCFSVAYGPYQALLADLFPASRRGSVNAVASLMSMFGQAGVSGGGALLAGVAPGAVFPLAALGLLLGFGVTALDLREPATSSVERAPSWGEQWRAAGAQKPALRYLACQWLLWFGINAVAPFLTLFMVKVYGTSETRALVAFLLIVLTTAIFALPAGRLGDRWGAKRALSLGLTLFVVSSLAMLLVRRYEEAAGLLLLAGAANAIATVLSYPFLTELVPAEHIGLFTGLNLGLQAVGVPLAIVSAGALIEVLGYSSLFALVAVTSAGSLAILQTVPDGRRASGLPGGPGG